MHSTADYAKDNQGYRRDIDGLRAVAVLAVIGFHAGSHTVRGGFVGVDVFFVISGFLISGILFRALDGGRFSFRHFYARRIRRIFPALILVLLAVWVIGWQTLMADEYAQLGEHIAAGAGFISNIVLWRQSGYFTGAGELKPLLHLWSLGVEEQYYLLWPLMLFLIWRVRVGRLKLFLLVLAVSFLANLGTVAVSPDSAFYLPHTRFWELMMGGTLAYIVTYKQAEFDAELLRILRPFLTKTNLVLHEVKAWLGMLLILGAVFFLSKTALFPGYWALLPTTGAFLLISAGADAWINRNVLSNRFMVYVGLISYPLYLWHWPLLAYVRVMHGSEPAPAVKLAAVLLAFVLAWFTYEYVEKPIRLGTMNLARRWAVPVLGLGMAAMLCVGAFTIRVDGLPGRYPEEIRQLVQYKPEEHGLGYRLDECLLNLNHDWHDYKASCTDSQPQDGALVFLWGDSHAADLYPGLRQLQSNYKFRIAEYDTALCPPVLDFDNPEQKLCKRNNDWVWGKIEELHPQIVLLSAQYWFLEQPDMKHKIFSTLAALKSSGVKTIIVVGPNPEWKQSLPRAEFAAYYRSGSFHKMPNRMFNDLSDETFTVNSQLSEWVQEDSVPYISPVSLLCDSRGCLTRVTENGTTDLTSYDQHHFTYTASEYFARIMLARFLPPEPRPAASATAKVGPRPI